MGRTWIFRYGAALAKEILGNIRGKYSSIPIPNDSVQLNASDLLSQASSEKDALITQLREFLDKLTKQEMLERQKAENDAMFEILSKIPVKIYIG
jgi:hypothetical protein